MESEKKIIAWQSPPARPIGQPVAMERWGTVALALMKRIGEWALIEATTRAKAQNLVHLINRQRPPFRAEYEGNYRFRGASHHDKERGLYLVYALYEEKEDE